MTQRKQQSQKTVKFRVKQKSCNMQEVKRRHNLKMKEKHEIYNL